MSPSSLSVWISERRLSRLTSITSPCSPARSSTRACRPESMLVSPVNCPGFRTAMMASAPDASRTSSTDPAATTNMDSAGSPTLRRISPGATERIRPWAATLFTWAGVRVGNTRSAGAESVTRTSGGEEAAFVELGPETSVIVQVLMRNVVFWDLACPVSSLVGVARVLDSADDSGLEGLALLDELFDALGIGELGPGEPLDVARLAARVRTQAGQGKSLRRIRSEG